MAFVCQIEQGLNCNYAHFVNSSKPLFYRGDYCLAGAAGANAGVFAFNDNTGGTNTNNSFRPVLVVV